jgi:hypothetical protein
VTPIGSVGGAELTISRAGETALHAGVEELSSAHSRGLKEFFS